MAKSPMEALKDEFVKAREEDKKLPRALTEAFVAGFHQALGPDFKEKIGETFNKIGQAGKDKALGFADKIQDTTKGIGSAIMSLTMFVGALVGLQAFLTGFEKAEKWFGDNADWGERISSALANVVATFTGMDETASKDLALKISSFIDSISSVATAIGGAATSVYGWLSGDTDMSTGDMLGSLKELGTSLWDNKLNIAAMALLVAPGSTMRLAITGMSLALTGISAAFGVIWPALVGIGAVIGSVGAVGAATIVGVVALVGTAINALYNGIVAFKDTWDETGSFMDGLNAFSKEFMAQFLGWPAKLLIDATAWVAGLFGWTDIEESLSGIDPVQGIRDFLDSVSLQFQIWDNKMLLAWYEVKAGAIGMWEGFTDAVSSVVTWIYDPATGKVFGIDWGQLLDDTVSYVVNTATAIPARIGSMFSTFWDNITGVFTNFFSSIGDWISNKTGIKFNWSPGDEPEFKSVTKQVGDRIAAEDSAMAQPFGVAASTRRLQPTARAISQEDIEAITALLERNEKLRSDAAFAKSADAYKAAIQQNMIINSTNQNFSSPVRTKTPH